MNLNLHLDALVLAGVLAMDGRVVAFHLMARLTREDLADVVVPIARRVMRCSSGTGSPAPMIAAAGLVTGNSRGVVERWQTQGRFFLGFNAILHWNDLDAGEVPARGESQRQ